VQFSKPLCPIDDKEAGKDILDIFVFRKEAKLIEDKEFGKDIFSKLVLSSNASCPIEDKEVQLDKLILIRVVHLLNALYSIEIIEVGRVTVVTFEHLENVLD
jgi:hypothetical protein